MNILKKIGSIFIAMCIMLSVVCFASADTVSKEKWQAFFREIPMGKPAEYSSNDMPYLRQYPKVVNVLSEIMKDIEVYQEDFDQSNETSFTNRLARYRIKGDVLRSNSRYKDILIFYAYVSALSDCNFKSGYSFRDGCVFGPLHFCIMVAVTDNNGKEHVGFYWIDKEECKQNVKQMMEGTYDIKENYFWKDRFENDDPDLLFLKHTQDAVIKYFGDIDSFFDDEELSTKFFKTMFETITNNGKSPGNGQKMISITSTDKTEAINDYKKLGQDIVKKTLEYKDYKEGKDYEIVYDEETGYIKEIKKVSNNILILGCIFLAMIVIATVVILIVVLSRRKR